MTAMLHVERFALVLSFALGDGFFSLFRRNDASALRAAGVVES